MKISMAVLRASWRSWISSDFRRVGPYWLQLVWTLVFAGALASGFTVLGFAYWAPNLEAWLNPALWSRWLGRNLIMCVTIAYVIHGLFELAGWAVGGASRICRFSMAQRSAFFGGIPVLGLIIGWPLGYWLAGGKHWQQFASAEGARIVIGSMVISLLIVFALYHWFEAKARLAIVERQATETQLRLLQAQIEPHFLFNTLANVHSLIDHDSVKAKAMLGAFTDYLRASLGGLRSEQVTLQDELALAEAYLRVQRTRLEGRLDYRIEVDAAARRAALLPLLLQPLVENALRHGIEPRLEGGRIDVGARREGSALVIEVSNDAPAPEAFDTSGSGVALGNIRQRLQTRYGDAAQVELSVAPAGVRARLRLPYTAADP